MSIKEEKDVHQPWDWSLNRRSGIEKASLGGLASVGPVGPVGPPKVRWQKPPDKPPDACEGYARTGELGVVVLL